MRIVDRNGVALWYLATDKYPFEAGLIEYRLQSWLVCFFVHGGGFASEAVSQSIHPMQGLGAARQCVQLTASRKQ